MTEKIHILLPVHNRREVTKRFIDCLKKQTYRDYRLILIDDGSTDGTEEMVRSQLSECTVLKGTGSWWWAGCLQQAYIWLKSNRIPTSEIVLIINDDVEFDDDFLQKAHSIMQGQTDALLLAHSYDRQSNELFDAGVYINWRKLTFQQARRQAEINCLSTRGLFLRIGDFYKIGGFYPRLLPHYLSDYEFTIRARKNGMKLMSSPQLRIRLDVTATGYRIFKRYTVKEFVTRVFSKKSIPNPLYWSVFIALACPWPWKPVNWFRVWKASLSDLFKSVLFSIKKHSTTVYSVLRR